MLLVNIYRETEHNDWVLFIVLSSIFVFVFSFSYLHRGGTLFHYLRQEITVSANNFISWVITSVVFVFLLSTFISQYIPILPEVVERHSVFGYTLNKFGYATLAISLFYLFRFVFTYLFFQSVGAGNRWARFYFSAGKFYLVFSLLLIGLCIFHYYFLVDSVSAFPYYIGLGVLVWVCKLGYYLFQSPAALPREWYYKILYICTLQIAPILVLYKTLF